MALIIKDNYFMREALELAKVSFQQNEVPVGAVIVKDNEIVGKGYNKKENLQISTRHAEIEAIEDACSNLNTWRLNDCVLYSTLEPCLMCAGAIIHSRIKKVVIGTKDYKTGACGSLYNLLLENKLNHKSEVKFGILEEECSNLLKSFFKLVREGKIKKVKF